DHRALRAAKNRGRAFDELGAGRGRGVGARQRRRSFDTLVVDLVVDDVDRDLEVRGARCPGGRLRERAGDVFGDAVEVVDAARPFAHRLYDLELIECLDLTTIGAA